MISIKNNYNVIRRYTHIYNNRDFVRTVRTDRTSPGKRLNDLDFLSCIILWGWVVLMGCD